MDTVKYVEGARGCRVAVLDGFSYHKSKSVKAGVKLVCSKRKALKCSASLVVDEDDSVVIPPSEHSHPPNAGDVEARQLKANMRKRARDEATPMHVIYEQEKVKLLQPDTTSAATPTEVASALPQFPSVRTVLYRERRKRFPTMPPTRADINLDGQWTLTSDGQRFLLAEDGEGASKLLIFASTRSLQELANAETFHVDGTFESAPRLFYQIIALHANCLGVMKPLVFGLLPNKEGATYVRFLRLVKEKAAELGIFLNPQRVMQDFEIGLMKASLEVFPDVVIKGCNFHFAQCLWRKLQGLGLATHYQESSEVRQWFRMVLALPFLPEPQVAEGFTFTKEATPTAPRIEEFNAYFEKTWMKGQYPLAMWNFFKHDGPRTNNHVEGYHARLKKMAGKPHPNIFEVVELFSSEEAASLVHIMQMHSGQKPPKRRRKYDDADERLNRLGLQYMLCERDLGSYLNAVGHMMDNVGVV